MKNLLGSNLATRIGLALLLVLTLGSAYLQMDLLASFLVAVLLLCLASFLWARLSLRGVEVALPVEDVCAFPGEELEAQVALSNKKFLPLMWLRIVLDTGEARCVAPTEDAPAEEGVTGISEKVLWIMPHQRVSWMQRARAVRRGVCRIEKAILASGDGFGLASQTRERRLPAPFRFVVYPEIREVDPTLILHNMTELERSSSGFYTDATLIKSIRDYADGDSFKDINYRVMARTGKVQVNVREKLAMRRVCFIPDIESFLDSELVEQNGEKHRVRRPNEPCLEKMLSLIASLIVALHEKEVLCSLVVPSAGGSEARVLSPETRDGQVMQLLTALSEIECTTAETALPVDGILDARGSLGQIFLFSRSIREESCERLTKQLEEVPVIHVVQDGRGDADEHSNKIFEETDFWSV